MSEGLFAKTYFEVLGHYSYQMTHAYAQKEGSLIGHLATCIRILSILGVLGYVNEFRYGTSMYKLIISRSSKYGLRTDQPRIRFETTPSKTVLIKFIDPSAESVETIECGLEYLHKEVTLFEKLLSFEID